jgi:hypothetical protein
MEVSQRPFPSAVNCAAASKQNAVSDSGQEHRRTLAIDRFQPPLCTPLQDNASW